MQISSALNTISRISRLTHTCLFKYTFLFIILSASFFLARPLLAQVNPIFQNYIESTDEAAGPNRTNMVGHGMLWEDIAPGLAEGLVGKDLMSVDPANPPANGTGMLPGGVIGVSTNLVASLYTPQASGVEYIASTWNNFLGKPAYAQEGVGFAGLRPLLPLWRGFRNIVYLLASIFFIIIGILIILRVKISPQAVINIQNSIPQLITTLILVTFSYAIAGLFIDLANLIQGIAISTLFTAFNGGSGGNLFNGVLMENWVTRLASWLGVNSQGNYTMAELMGDSGFWQSYGLMIRMIPTVTLSLIGGFLGAIIGGVTGAGIGAIPGVVVGAVLGLLIVSIIVLVNLISFLFSLLKVYINVLIKIIFAPLEIGLGALPGSKTNFSSWMWELIAYLAVFPFSFIYLLVANLIVSTIADGQLWTPPIIGGLAGIANGRVLAGLVGLGAFLLFAQLPDKIPTLIFQIKPSEWGKAIGEAATIGGTPIGKFGLQTASNYQAGRYKQVVENYEKHQGNPPSDRQRKTNKVFDFLGYLGTVKR